MTSPFADRDAKLSGALDRAFGETFTFLPFTASGDINLPKIPDVGRVQFDVKAVWEGAAKRSTPAARGAIQDDNAHSWNVSMPSITVDDSLLRWALVANCDRVVRQFDGGNYQISAALPDGMGRTTILLTNRKR